MVRTDKPFAPNQPLVPPRTGFFAQVFELLRRLLCAAPVQNCRWQALMQMAAGLADNASSRELVLLHEAVEHGRGRLGARYVDLDPVLRSQSLRVLATGAVSRCRVQRYHAWIERPGVSGSWVQQGNFCCGQAYLRALRP